MRWILLLFFSLWTLQGALAAPPHAQALFPTADRFDKVTGEPPAAAVYGGDRHLGYLFETNDVAPIPAYSGKPVNVLVGIDTQGRITGARVLEHHEPILLIGIPEESLTRFVDQYVGKRVTDRVKVGAGNRAGYVHVDAISGATVTVMVINEVIMRSARLVYQSRIAAAPAPVAAPQQPAAEAVVRADFDERADWIDLISSNALRRLKLTRGEVDSAFAGSAAAAVDRAETPEAAAEDFIDLYYGYLNIPAIGRNLLGDAHYRWLMGELDAGEHAIVVLGSGRYSFKGSGYVRGGIFDRLQLQQDNQAISFRDRDYHRLYDLALSGAPDFDEMAIFIVRAEQPFDPADEWLIELLVRRQTGPLESEFTSFTGPYQLAQKYLRYPAPEIEEALSSAAGQPADAAAAAQLAAVAEAVVAGGEEGEKEAVAALLTAPEPLWVQLWRERIFQIVVLGVGLTALLTILMLQDWLVRFPRAMAIIRPLFLLYTVIFIGWYALAQLSVVNVLTFTNALINDFSWDSFLIDPMMFILWSFVAMTLLLWGRGVYCGWLCPFGAMQDLINRAARFLKVPQVELPFAVHERLWAIKYLILLVLFGISLHSLASAEIAAEVEPFKTAVTLKFQREWGFLLYALALLAMSAVNHKFYCRYLCPLGAGLAIGGKFRLFDWLKRRKECGKPCQICADECEIRAIHPTGEINANECHYCLDCQLTYVCNRKCPPLIEKRKKLEKLQAIASKPATTGQPLAASTSR